VTQTYRMKNKLKWYSLIFPNYFVLSSFEFLLCNVALENILKLSQAHRINWYSNENTDTLYIFSQWKVTMKRFLLILLHSVFPWTFIFNDGSSQCWHHY